MKKVLLRRQRYKLVMQGLFCGVSGVYEIGIREKPFPCTEVSFQKLSESEEIEALNLGFSPAIHLPYPSPYDAFLGNSWGELATPLK
ncbi:MAG TPA: hypothetical protein VK203_22645 [Nostocaceae cyanobacterium]|nr:hypothetical protein [Nostocaceae cyanobacterium]